MEDWQVYVNERNAIVETEMNAYNALYKSLDIPALIISDK